MVDRKRRIIEHRLPEEGWNERRTIADLKSKVRNADLLLLYLKIRVMGSGAESIRESERLRTANERGWNI
jgi:hypothetical protein